MLLVVMYQSQTWRLDPGEAFTFGRADTCTVVLPADDLVVSRRAGSLSFDGCWWLRNESSSSLLYVSGDLGFRVDLSPGMRLPLEQWHLKLRLPGSRADYVLRLRLPDLDDVPDALPAAAANGADALSAAGGPARTKVPLPLTADDRLVLAARFEEYLTWRHTGLPAPRSAAQTADRIGWQTHTVIKRCENIRQRYIRTGAPGLRGPRALEELASLLLSTGTLTADDLRLLPPQAR